VEQASANSTFSASVRSLWAAKPSGDAVPKREKPKATELAMAGPKLGSGFKVTFVDRKVADAFFRASLGEARGGPTELPLVCRAPKGMAHPQPGDLLESVDGKKLLGATDTRARALELVALVKAESSFMARFIKGDPDDVNTDEPTSDIHSRFMASPSSKMSNALAAGGGVDVLGAEEEAGLELSSAGDDGTPEGSQSRKAITTEGSKSKSKAVMNQPLGSAL
jgi:hypothetical protein